MDVFRKNEGLLKGYDKFSKDLYQLDKKYYDMKENPTALFEKFRGSA
jgi:hypothetical protein